MRTNTQWIARVRREPKPKSPTIESVHRDIGFANAYRQELIKHLLTISAALFAFTVTFRPSLETVQWRWAMWIGWAGLALSMMGGIVNMLGWDHYYKSYRDYDYKYRDDPDPERGRREGKRKRAEVNGWRVAAMVVQFAGFAVGVFGVGSFAGVNIDAVHKAAAPVAQACVAVPQCNAAIAAGMDTAASAATSAPVGKP